jgi:VanZ family protein
LVRAVPDLIVESKTSTRTITDELHQGVVSGRHASPVDVGIDALGPVIAIAFAGLVPGRRGRAGLLLTAADTLIG